MLTTRPSVNMLSMGTCRSGRRTTRAPTAACIVRRELSGVQIDRLIIDRDYQIACIDALSGEVSRGRRKLLVEMATGAGKTRTRQLQLVK